MNVSLVLCIVVRPTADVLADIAPTIVMCYNWDNQIAILLYVTTSCSYTSQILLRNSHILMQNDAFAVCYFITNVFMLFCGVEAYAKCVEDGLTPLTLLVYSKKPLCYHCLVPFLIFMTS